MDNLKYVILGLGIEGQASLRFLLSKNIDEKNIYLADKNEKALENDVIKELAKNLLRENIFLGNNYLDALDCCDIVIKSSGISINNTPKLSEYIKSKKIKLSSNTDLFFENKKGTVIGITGSKGKSTTTTLTYEIFKNAGLKANLVGNIGNPSTDTLKDDTKDSFYIFEMSSYQLENFDHLLDAGIFTSFFPEHLDYHLTLENYLNAKLNLITHIKDDGFLIYNKSLEQVYPNVLKLNFEKQVSFNDVDRVEDNYIYINNKKYIDTNALKLIGKHNFQNAIAAIKMAKHFNISDDIIKNSLKNFNPLPHRLEKVAPLNGIYFIDDAISTTPESTIAGIESVNMPVYSIILGGLDRGYNFKELINVIYKKDIKRIAFLKDSGLRILEEMKSFYKSKNGQIPAFKIFDSMDGVVSFCIETQPKNTICLLSCASPSYSIFKNYIEKGNLFKESIEKLRLEIQS